MQYLERDWGVPQPEREVWSRHWMAEGFAAFEALLQHHPSTGEFCDGVAPGIADCCLIPQVYNARRFGVDLTPYPTIRSEEHTSELQSLMRISYAVFCLKKKKILQTQKKKQQPTEQ